MEAFSFQISRNSAFALHCYGNSFSSGVTIYWRPFLGRSLNTRNGSKGQVFHAQKLNYEPVCASLKSGFKAGLTNDGLLSNKLEFKPSFDDYLKEMESSRTVKEMESSRNVRVKKHATSTEKQKREKVMPRKPRLEVIERSTKFGKLAGRVDKANELGIAETVMGKESSSVGHIKLRSRGANRFDLECDGEESKLEVMEDRYRIDSSKPDSDRNLIRRERRKTGNIKASLNWNSNCGNTRKEEVGHEVHTLKTSGGKDVKTSQIYCNSKGKMPIINKTVVSNNVEHNGLENSYTKTENVGKENGPENLNLIGSSRCYDYDNLEVERAAFKTFEEYNGVVNTPQVSHKDMEDRIQRLANSLNGADINIPEWIFSKMMRSAKIKFNDYSIVRVIQRLGKLGNWQRVIQVIEWLQRLERFKSHKLRHIYTAALDALGKARRPIEALNVFHAMLQQISTYPDLVAYHSIAVTLGQAGRMKELFDVIDIMQLPPKKKFKVGALGNWDPRLEPDVIVYNAVLNACVQQKEWEGAFWVLQQLKKQRQQPSATTYGLVMEVMFTCGKYNLVHEFFMKVRKFSIPNSLTYRVLVNTLWKEGNTDEAILAVQDMERRGIVGSASLYYDLARCLCAAGRCSEALTQIEKICKVANKPLVVTYTGLIQACLESGNIQDGAYIFGKMKDICSPNLVTCNMMLKAYLEHGIFEEGKELFEKMSESTNHVKRNSDYKIVVMPDIYSFNTMLDACIVEKRWNYFNYVYQKMLDHGYHFNPKRHLRMILAASRAGKEEPIETTWKYLIQTDRIIPATLIKERFCMKLEKDDHVEALGCITNGLSKDLNAFSKLSWLNLLKENGQRFQRDTLVRLMDDVNTLVSKSSLPLPALEALEKLMLSLKEFCSPDLSETDIKQLVNSR
ncbi:hypothetical protein QN277_010125 [Acacia crassicarpa]|uniref:Pentatricopeptide repeat-containing protein n=1 Tax=Acacia crassicarpa TaxID=499986 RepID=A0AAE1INS2_9FABA|nr:hypothetical protein QN277_010125 [Acacia crassicarpa]